MKVYVARHPAVPESTNVAMKPEEVQRLVKALIAVCDAATQHERSEMTPLRAHIEHLDEFRAALIKNGAGT